MRKMTPKRLLLQPILFNSYAARVVPHCILFYAT